LYGKHAVGKVVQYYTNNSSLPGGRRQHCRPLTTFSRTATSFHTPVKFTMEIETTPELFEEHTRHGWEISKDFLNPALQMLKDVSKDFLKSGRNK